MATDLAELWHVLLDLSPSLLLGLLIAGLIHVYLPAGLIHRSLSRPNLTSSLIRVRGGVTDAAALVRAVEAAGFQVSEPPANTATR